METNHPNDAVSPFVTKTYQMVNDPTTDDLIAWGNADNTFVVADPLELSRRILPSYFKHNNFSSFVRQLNTYGFKKVDPDKWEFASQWFLRGQKNLLKNISRRKYSRNSSNNVQVKCEEDDGELAMEIAKLKEEQRALDIELESMNKRIEATEKRPQQMMAFLYKIMENPEIFPGMMLQNRRSRRQLPDKRRRFVMPPPSPVKIEKAAAEESSPETGVFADNAALSSPESPLCWSTASPLTTDSGSGFGDYLTVSPPESSLSVYGCGGGRDSYLAESVAGEEPSPPPYPFSLFSGGF